MIAFEITELDVQQAVEQHMNIELSDEEAEEVLSLLDEQEVSDEAAWESDSDGGDEADEEMNEATDRAGANIIDQIHRDKKKFSFIFDKKK